MKFAIVIPTLNAEQDGIDNLLTTLQQQTVAPDLLWVIDSSSSDNTVAIAEKHGARVSKIDQDKFNHGGTRRDALEKLAGGYDITVFMTQDIKLTQKDCLERLLDAFTNPAVAIAYGRQIARKENDLIEHFNRADNYPAQSHIRSFSDQKTYGLKTAFNSNAFSAYRCDIIQNLDAIPKRTTSGEDFISAMRVLQAGFKIAYVAEACVLHEHSFSLKSAIKRYFDIGVFHRAFTDELTDFGRAEKSGTDHTLKKIRFLLQRRKRLIPLAIFQDGIKYLAFKTGKQYRRLPPWVRLKLTASPSFFK